MDLVAGVRKEGSRGGRDSFKWSDVKESSHRENYLGHSLMAPVGRWQQGRDLNWYAKNKDENSEEAAERAKQERIEELRRVKEAEQDAMARALGLPVAPRSNANMTPLGNTEVRKAVQESTDMDGKADEGRGIGFGSFGGLVTGPVEGEILAPVGIDSGIQARGQIRDDKGRRDRSYRSRRDRSKETDRRRSRDRRDNGPSHRHDRNSEREHRHHHHREHRTRRRHRSRSRSISREPRREYREDNRERRHDSDRHRDAGRSGRHQSNSPRHDNDNGRDRNLDRDHRYHRR